MDNKPIQYNYKGEIIYIYPGSYFSKNELILRLKEMNFTNVDSTYEKQDLVTMYEIATNYENNIEKILPRLRKDYQYMKLKEKFKSENKRDIIILFSIIFVKIIMIIINQILQTILQKNLGLLILLEN